VLPGQRNVSTVSNLTVYTGAHLQLLTCLERGQLKLHACCDQGLVFLRESLTVLCAETMARRDTWPKLPALASLGGEVFCPSGP
jgi:hypothetical protein